MVELREIEHWYHSGELPNHALGKGIYVFGYLLGWWREPICACFTKDGAVYHLRLPKRGWYRVEFEDGAPYVQEIVERIPVSDEAGHLIRDPVTAHIIDAETGLFADVEISSRQRFIYKRIWVDDYGKGNFRPFGEYFDNPINQPFFIEDLKLSTGMVLKEDWHLTFNSEDLWFKDKMGFDPTSDYLSLPYDPSPLEWFSVWGSVSVGRYWVDNWNFLDWTKWVDYQRHKLVLLADGDGTDYYWTDDRGRYRSHIPARYITTSNSYDIEMMGRIRLRLRENPDYVNPETELGGLQEGQHFIFRIRRFGDRTHSDWDLPLIGAGVERGESKGGPRMVFTLPGVLTPAEGSFGADKYLGTFPFDAKITRMEIISERMASQNGELKLGVLASEPLLGIRPDLDKYLKVYLPKNKNHGISDERELPDEDAVGELIVYKNQHIILRAEKVQGLVNTQIVLDYQKL